MEENGVVDRCPHCNEEMFPVYFTNEGMFQGVTYKRCMACNIILPFKAGFEQE